MKIWCVVVLLYHEIDWLQSIFLFTTSTAPKRVDSLQSIQATLLEATTLGAQKSVCLREVVLYGKTQGSKLKLN